MPTQFRTHYDNLKVSRTAPPEVIAAAYRALSKQLHPDVNRGSSDAERVMAIINKSYEVLSDPLKRQKHDEWIRFKEARLASDSRPIDPNARSKRRDERVPKRPKPGHIERFGLLYLIAGVVGIGILSNSSESPTPSGLPPYDSNPTVAAANTASDQRQRPAYVRPAAAPNGKAWPTTSAYISGYPIGRAHGLSKLTIDNSANSTDVFIKLVALDSDKTSPVRQAFIPAYGSFTMNDIDAGRYDVRYKNLSDGSLSRSESFELVEIPGVNGTQFSDTTMTLYKISNGNMQTYPLDVEEF